MPGIPAAQLVTEIKQAEHQAVTTERGQLLGREFAVLSTQWLPPKGIP